MDEQAIGQCAALLAGVTEGGLAASARLWYALGLLDGVEVSAGTAARMAVQAAMPAGVRAQLAVKEPREERDYGDESSDHTGGASGPGSGE